MSNYKRTLCRLSAMAFLLLSAWNAAAAEIGDFCWQTEAGLLLKFSVSEAGQGHFNYMGMFSDTDGADLAISGHVAVVGGVLIGSFSGSKTTTTNFKTAIYRVAFDPTTFAGSAEGIRHKYDRLSTNVSTEYRTHTLTLVTCP